ncbi:stage III sporulation protein SpoIIIAB [Clostridium sp.]|uniref:stage III sporulation protein SpoIIIAB n=1 Tax=Clostridium sp. TaxID=1506 RepID=UPI003F326734
MLKIIAIIIIFLSFTYMGFYFGDSFKKRSRQLNEILKSLLLLNNEIIYANTPLPEALNYVGIKVENPVGNLLVNISKNLTEGKYLSVYETFKEEYKKMKDRFYLSSEDEIILSDFFKSLGESGIYGQDKIFNLTIENIKMCCKESEAVAKKNTKMYRAIGACLGAMISIFLL